MRATHCEESVQDDVAIHLTSVHLFTGLPRFARSDVRRIVSSSGLSRRSIQKKDSRISAGITEVLLLSFPLFENQRCIYTTERKIVCHYSVTVNFTTISSNIVKWRTFRVYVFQIYVWMEPPLIHHIDC